MGSVKNPQCDPDPDNNPVKASPANDCQNNARFIYLVKENTFNWNVLVQKSSPVSHRYCGRGKPLDLGQSTRRTMKVAEKEETLVGHSKKVEEASRKREEELPKHGAN